MNNYIERMELGEGQWATLLTRLPADRAQRIRVALVREQDERAKTIALTDPIFAEAVRDAVLWECSVKDYLTGEITSDINRADPRISDEVEVKALELYIAWSVEAYPGPKGRSRTDAPTRTSKKAASTSGTSAPR